MKHARRGRRALQERVGTIYWKGPGGSYPAGWYTVQPDHTLIERKDLNHAR